MEITMAEISQIKVLDGSVYDLKDSTARDTLRNISARTPISLGVQGVTSNGGTVTWTNENITSDSIVHLYSSVYGVTATDVVVTSGALTATFPPSSVSYVVNATVDGTATADGGSISGGSGGGSGTSVAGVTSFNGRSGIVVPQTGDYSYSMITGTPSAATPSKAGLMSATDKVKLDELSTTTKLEIKTLKAGDTNVSWENINISASSMIEFYASIYGVYPVIVECSSTSISAEFPMQTSDMQVCAIIMPE